MSVRQSLLFAGVIALGLMSAVVSLRAEASAAPGLPMSSVAFERLEGPQ